MRNRVNASLCWGRALALGAVSLLGLVAIVGSGGGGGDANCSFFSNVCNPDVGPFPPLALAEIQPHRVTVQVGTAVTFTLQTSGVTNPSFQWRRSADGGRSYVDIAGATGTSYTLAGANLADDAAAFSVEVRNATGVTVATAVASLAVSSMPGVVFADTEFAPAHWAVATIADPAASGPTHTEEQALDGGHPGAFRRMTHTLPQGPSTLRVAHAASQAGYDPTVQGGIYSIDYAEDCILLGNSSLGYLVDSRLLIEQGGRRYVSAGVSRCLSSAWSALSARVGLGVQDFVLLDGPACGTGESCPDFAGNAAMLRFGFLRQSQDPIAGAGTLTHGIDNWKVTVWRH